METSSRQLHPRRFLVFFSATQVSRAAATVQVGALREKTSHVGGAGSAIVVLLNCLVKFCTHSAGDCLATVVN
jgi:hypothetical protein